VWKEGGYHCVRGTFWVECVKTVSSLSQTLTPIYHATCSEPGTYQTESG